MRSSAPSNKRARLDRLTSLRFFAALLVVVFHFGNKGLQFGQDAMANAPFWVQGLAQNGYSSVSFFFVLSGFVLAYNYFSDDSPSGLRVTPRAFWVARAARIYPVYIIALGIALPPFCYGTFQAHVIGVDHFAFGLFLVPLMLQAWIPSMSMTWNSPAWSLSVEALFYASFPLLARWLVRRDAKQLLCVSFVLVGLSSLIRFLLPQGNEDMQRFAAYFPLLHLPSFLVGVSLGSLFLKGVMAGFPTSVRWFDLSLCALCALFALRTKLPHFLYSDACLVPLFAVVIYSGAIAAKFKRSVLDHPVLVLLGEASYGLYILHIPLGFWFIWVLKNTLPSSDWSRGGCVCLVFVVFVTGASVLCYEFVEKPCRRYIQERFML